jgi:hypothetical protein
MKRLLLAATALLAIGGYAYSQSTITWPAFVAALGAASTLAGTESIAGVQSAAGVKITPAQIATYLTSGANSWSGVQTFTSLKVTTRVSTGTVGSPDAISATTDYFICNTYSSTGAAGELLPAGATGLTFLIKDCGGQAATHNLTISTTAGNIDGASTYVISTNYGSVAVTYVNGQWAIN